MTFAWTDQHVDKLRKLWAAGRSCSSIARELGGDELSRNAVIGKIGRLGLSGRVKVKPSAPPVVIVKPAPPPRLPPIVEAPVRVKEPTDVTAAFQPGDRRTVSLMQLPTFGACRWPFDMAPTRYCGAVTTNPDDPNCSYCAEHAALAYTKPMGQRTIRGNTP